MAGALAFVFHNKSTTQRVSCATRLAGSMFRQCRVLCAGVEVMDLQDYGRAVQMFETLMPFNRQKNDQVESFGSFTAPTGTPATFTQPFKPIPVPASESRRV